MDKLIISSYTKVIMVIGIRRLATIGLIFFLHRFENVNDILSIKATDIYNHLLNATLGDLILSVSTYGFILFSSVAFILLLNLALENTPLGRKHLETIEAIKEAKNKFQIPLLSESQKLKYIERKKHVLKWFDINILIFVILYFCFKIYELKSFALVFSFVYLFISMYKLNFYYLSHLNGYILFVSRKMGRKIRLSEYHDLEKLL